MWLTKRHTLGSELDPVANALIAWRGAMDHDDYEEYIPVGCVPVSEVLTRALGMA